MNKPNGTSPSIGICATLACAWEVIAPKPGNVHRSADFESTTFLDFVTSAIAIGPVMERAASLRLGEVVLQSVEATTRWVSTNTNLGLILLLAPLAKAAAFSSGRIATGDLTRCLNELNETDAADVYRAINLAKPGGLGSAPRWDVAGDAPQDLIAAMRVAAARDMIALQYTNGFEQVFGFVVPELEQHCDKLRLMDAIVYTQMRTMAAFPDSLIGRKCGPEVARTSARRAVAVLQHAPGSEEYLNALSDFDFWLRIDGNRRNPGTTADLIGAGLFVALRNGSIQTPVIA